MDHSSRPLCAKALAATAKIFSDTLGVNDRHKRTIQPLHPQFVPAAVADNLPLQLDSACLSYKNRIIMQDENASCPMPEWWIVDTTDLKSVFRTEVPVQSYRAHFFVLFMVQYFTIKVQVSLRLHIVFDNDRHGPTA